MSSKKVRIAVIGASGYAGAELVRILSGHPAVRLTVATSRQYAGNRFDSLYPALKDCTDIQLESYSEERVCQNADIVFTALPHRLPMSIVPEILANDRKVIDLSADFRFSDPERYGAAYQSHTAPDLLKEAVYGLSEVYADRIRSARLVGNPGCYPTSVLLPLVPLVRRGLVETDFLVADATARIFVDDIDEFANRVLAVTYDVAGFALGGSDELAIDNEQAVVVALDVALDDHRAPVFPGLLEGVVDAASGDVANGLDRVGVAGGVDGVGGTEAAGPVELAGVGVHRDDRGRAGQGRAQQERPQVAQGHLGQFQDLFSAGTVPGDFPAQLKVFF